MRGGYFVDFEGNERFVPKGRKVTLWVYKKCDYRERSATPNEPHLDNGTNQS